MTNKKNTATIVPQFDGDDEVRDLNKKLKISHRFELVAIWSFVLLVGWLVSVYFRNTAIRFAITHPVESTKFAEGYYRVQQLSKQAASEVVTNWVKERI